jgi:hypothetical protein
MNRLQQAALLTSLVDSLRQQKSWCGETHIQKAAFVVTELAQIPWTFEFVMYKHGPFSFDLRAELTALRADDLLTLVPQPAPYGPRYQITPTAQLLQDRFPKTLARHKQSLMFVAQRLGESRVDELERLATAIYATTRQCPNASVEDRAVWLNREKPHIPLEDARAAVTEADELIVSFRSQMDNS